jgi:hypothetical protein
MQRHLLRALAASIYPLIGLAALMALAGCTTVPSMNLANGMIRPGQMPQTAAPSPDVFSGLAQRMNVMPPTAGDSATATAAR